MAKSRIFKSLKHSKIKTIRYFRFFLNFDLAKGWASVPFLVAPLFKYTATVFLFGYSNNR